MRTPRPDHRQLKLKFVMWYSQPARRQIVDHVYLLLRLKEDGITANWLNVYLLMPVDAQITKPASLEIQLIFFNNLSANFLIMYNK